QGSSTGRRRPFSGADVGSPPALVLSGSQLLQLGCASFDRLLVKLLEEGNTPPAARAGAAALGELTGDFGPVPPHEIDQLAARHVKTVTDFRIQIHQPNQSVVRSP